MDQRNTIRPKVTESLQPNIMEPKSTNGKLRLFSILTGKTNNSHKKFTDTLINEIQDLREGHTVDESHIVLVFCPIVSRAGTDIEAALRTFTDSTGSKLNVLVVLHHTSDPEKTVPDSSRCVNRTDILTVDCLFYEDTGLLECQKNQDAVDKVVNWLIEEGEEMGLTVSRRQRVLRLFSVLTGTKNNSHKKLTDTPTNQIQDLKEDHTMAEMGVMSLCQRGLFSILTGKTNNSHMKFTETLINQIQDLREVSTVNESDIVLVFCPIVSKTGVNIEAALKTFNDSTASKLKILVVLHHTFDPEKTVPDSSRCVKRTDILTVDCLFYEDTGLLKCQKNQDAVDKVVNWLIEEGKKRGVNVSLRQMFNQKFTPNKKTSLLVNPAQSKEEGQETRVTHGKKQQHAGGLRLFSILTGKTNNSHKKFTDTLINQIQDLREASTVNESDIVLVFCPIVSQTGANIEAALKTFTDSSAFKLNVLVVLHHTFDPEKTVPDSSRCVNWTDILTVDCLYYEDKGLLECQKNQDAMDKVVNWLIEEGKKRGVNVSLRQKLKKKTTLNENPRPSVNPDQSEEERQETPVTHLKKHKPVYTGGLRLFSVLTGKTNNSHMRFTDTLINEIQDLREVSTVDESDIVLVFCTIVSQAGTDIKAAMKTFTDSTAFKLKVLVVLHHTFDPEKTVPDSSRCVSRKDILTVDCLFYEDTGLLECQKNQDAMDKVVNWLIEEGKKRGINVSLRQKKSSSWTRLFQLQKGMRNVTHLRKPSH